MLKYFPLSAQTKGDVMHLLVVVVMYALAAWVVGIVGGILNILPIIRIVSGLLVWAIQLYCGVGAIVAILAFFKVIK